VPLLNEQARSYRGVHASAHRHYNAHFASSRRN
jgi:hypothetical protein